MVLHRLIEPAFTDLQLFGEIAPYSRARFIESHRGGAPEAAREFDEFMNDIPKLVAAYESHQSFQSLPTPPLKRRRRF
jgi:hypothetical protein